MIQEAAAGVTAVKTVGAEAAGVATFLRTSWLFSNAKIKKHHVVLERVGLVSGCLPEGLCFVSPFHK